MKRQKLVAHSCLQEIHIKYRQRQTGNKIRYHVPFNKRKQCDQINIRHKVLKGKLFTRGKQGYYIIIKDLIHQENIKAQNRGLD